MRLLKLLIALFCIWAITDGAIGTLLIGHPVMEFFSAFFLGALATYFIGDAFDEEIH